jgi:DNA-binding transcriptional regulator YiaG
LKAEEIKALRIALGMSQQQFAHRIKRSVTIVSRWETGNASPDTHSRDALRKLNKRAKR